MKRNKGKYAALAGGALAAGLGYTASEGMLGQGAQNVTQDAITKAKNLLTSVKSRFAEKQQAPAPKTEAPVVKAEAPAPAPKTEASTVKVEAPATKNETPEKKVPKEETPEIEVRQVKVTDKDIKDLAKNHGKEIFPEKYKMINKRDVRVANDAYNASLKGQVSPRGAETIANLTNKDKGIYGKNIAQIIANNEIQKHKDQFTDTFRKKVHDDTVKFNKKVANYKNKALGNPEYDMEFYRDPEQQKILRQQANRNALGYAAKYQNRLNKIIKSDDPTIIKRPGIHI